MMDLMLRIFIFSFIIVCNYNIYGQNENMVDSSDILLLIEREDSVNLHLSLVKYNIGMETIIDHENQLNTLECIISLHKNDLFRFIENYILKVENPEILYSYNLYAKAISVGNLYVMKRLKQYHELHKIERKVISLLGSVVYHYNILKEFNQSKAPIQKNAPPNIDVKLIDHFFLEHELNINMKPYGDYNILFTLIEFPHLIERLIEHGINLNTLDSEKMTIIDHLIKMYLGKKKLTFKISSFEREPKKCLHMIELLSHHGAKSAKGTSSWFELIKELFQDKAYKEFEILLESIDEVLIPDMELKKLEKLCKNDDKFIELLTDVKGYKIPAETSPND